MKRQLFPNNGNDLGPGSSEYSLAKSISSCDILAITVEDLARQIIAFLEFQHRLINKDIVKQLL